LSSSAKARTELAQRLRGRRGEIEAAVLTRVHAVAEASDGPELEYLDGLRSAIYSALDFGIDAVQCSEVSQPPIPTTLLAQARLAARHGIKLETVLRRYLAGYTLLGDFLIEESAKGGQLNSASLKRLLRVLAALFDRLIAAVSEEYGRDLESHLGSPAHRQAERVRQLLAGELLDAPELSYELSEHHLGVVATGPGAAEAFGELAQALDRRLLLVRNEGGPAWAWLGGRHPCNDRQLAELISSDWPPGVSVAIGEPAEGLAGWRLTHRQARAALPVGLRSSRSPVRYAEVAVLVSVLQDDLLEASLRQIYLEPLAKERDGGEVARQTLRAYIASECNVTSAAAALAINRNTVSKRLRAIESRIGRPLTSCLADLEVALRLDSLLKSNRMAGG